MERFKAHFSGFEDQYILIGGAACALALEDGGWEFRNTRDLDIVLALEELRPEFVLRFWEFVRHGGYQARERESGGQQYYRFSRPEVVGYPHMLELFSRVPDSLRLSGAATLTPIPVEEGVRSLSAILLNEEYYRFLKSGRVVVAGVPIVRAEYLVALKAKAWLDLSKRKSNGEPINSGDISKHRKDVFRLFPVIDQDLVADAPLGIRKDVEIFLAEIPEDGVDLRALGIDAIALPNAIAVLRKIYSSIKESEIGNFQK
jgi:hypothetical protein